MENKKQNNGIKMVMCFGMLIPESRVEGRLKALAFGSNLKNILKKDQAEEERQMADKGYSPQEIACLRHANRIKAMEHMGLGTPSRVRRIGRPA